MRSIGNLTLWDTPGLGDIAQQGLRSKDAIQSLPAETDGEGATPLIDLVLVVMDDSSKDLGTTCRVLNGVIIPAAEDLRRILAALNQADSSLSMAYQLPGETPILRTCIHNRGMPDGREKDRSDGVQRL